MMSRCSDVQLKFSYFIKTKETGKKFLVCDLCHILHKLCEYIECITHGNSL